MQLIELLATADAPVIADLVATSSGTTEAKWDNRPTWDNWSNSTPSPWNNQPTWDNWSKSN